MLKGNRNQSISKQQSK